jgi:hypothetical protein
VSVMYVFISLDFLLMYIQLLVISGFIIHIENNLQRVVQVGYDLLY